MDTEHHPTVTVGLPVYNGQNYVSEAIESILDQSLRDFELIISDNCSNDDTQEICRRFADTDSRIRYVRNEENLGAANNFNRTVELARGKYFKWAAHDDVLHDQLLARSVEALEDQPAAVLAYSKIVTIDESGKEIGTYDSLLHHSASADPDKRFGDVVFGHQLCYEVFGVIRTDVLRRTPLIGAYVTSDRNLLAELILLGPFVEVPEPLLHIRHHKHRSVSTARHDRLEWFDTKKSRRIAMPYWREYCEYVKSVRRVRPSLRVQKSCVAYVLKRMAQNWRFLRGDVRIAATRAVFRGRSG